MIFYLLRPDLSLFKTIVKTQKKRLILNGFRTSSSVLIKAQEETWNLIGFGSFPVFSSKNKKKNGFEYNICVLLRFMLCSFVCVFGFAESLNRQNYCC